MGSIQVALDRAHLGLPIAGFDDHGIDRATGSPGRAERQRHEAESELSQSQATLREFAGKLLTAEQTERGESRELHDDLGQGLALLSVELDLLQQKPPEEPSNSRLGWPRFRPASNSFRLRFTSLSHRLHPMKLEQLGLVATLRALCKELSESHGLEIEFLHDAIPAPFLQTLRSACIASRKRGCKIL